MSERRVVSNDWTWEGGPMAGASKAALLFGIGALVTIGAALLVWLVVALVLLAPMMFWFAWNVLDFGPAIGLPELGLWAILLATAFLMVGWFAKTLIAAIVFLVDPGWLSGTAELQWPEPSFRNLVAITILAVLASRPHARVHHGSRDDD